MNPSLTRYDIYTDYGTPVQEQRPMSVTLDDTYAGAEETAFQAARHYGGTVTLVGRDSKQPLVTVGIFWHYED